MGTLLLYILKSTICLTLFYIGFKALLSNDTFFRFNRWVMLGGMSICMLLPVFEIKTAEPLLIQQPFMHLEEMIMGEGTNSVALSGGASGMRIVPAVEPAVAVDWGQLSFFAYLIGILICLTENVCSYPERTKVATRTLYVDIDLGYCFPVQLGTIYHLVRE